MSSMKFDISVKIAAIFLTFVTYLNFSKNDLLYLFFMR